MESPNCQCPSVNSKRFLSLLLTWVCAPAPSCWKAVFGEYPWVTFPTCFNITNTFGARHTHTHIALHFIALLCIALQYIYTYRYIWYNFTSVWINKTMHVQYWALSELLSSRCWVLATPLLPSSALGTGHGLSSPSSSRICWFVNGACSFGWFV